VIIANNIFCFFIDKQSKMTHLNQKNDLKMQFEISCLGWGTDVSSKIPTLRAIFSKIGLTKTQI
jgi:hypothetical protein